MQPDGTLVPCTLLGQLALGRIGHDPLEQVWRESPLLQRLRARRAIPLAGFAHCAGCAYIPHCSGGCPAEALSLSGELDHPSPEACLRCFLAAGGQPPAAAAGSTHPRRAGGAR